MTPGAPLCGLVALSLLFGCGGGRPADDERSASGGADPTPPSAPLDSALAVEGRRAFRNRGCIACHKVGGGKLVGPDLAGVPRTRAYEWYRHIVLRPDSMLVHDSLAMALLREYATPMPNQRASEAEVRSIWEYLRWEDRPAPEP